MHPHIVKAVSEANYAHTTAIQNRVIPPAMKGLDILGASKSGTGKTAAFVLPLLLLSSPLGTLWEIFEFSMDAAWGINMQKSGLVDTMWDLIVDGIGALFASIVGFVYLKGGKTHLFEKLLMSFVKKNPKFFKNI